jgi:hypothetical protein
VSVLTPEQEEDFGFYAENDTEDPGEGVYRLRLQTIFCFFYIVDNLGLPLEQIDSEYNGCLTAYYGGYDTGSYCHMVVGMSKVSLYISRPGEETIYHGGLVSEFDFDKFRPLLASLSAPE